MKLPCYMKKNFAVAQRLLKDVRQDSWLLQVQFWTSQRNDYNSWLVINLSDVVNKWKCSVDGIAFFFLGQLVFTEVSFTLFLNWSKVRNCESTNIFCAVVEFKADWWGDRYASSGFSFLTTGFKRKDLLQPLSSYNCYCYQIRKIPGFIVWYYLIFLDIRIINPELGM